MQQSIPCTPQQNGVAERKNISLKEMETCMMESKNFPPKFWAEAIKFASYIHNRVPHKNFEGITPLKSWSGHKPDVSHFRILALRLGLEFQQKIGRLWNPKFKSSFFWGILNIPKGII